MKLRDLGFSDIYIGQNESLLGGVTGESDPVPAPAEVQMEVSQLRQTCDELQRQEKRQEFTVRHDDVTYRGSVLHAISGQVYVLRKFATTPPELTELGLPGAYLQRLLEPRMSGLVIVSGAVGQGKTTTASSILLGRISAFGGVAITIEDPPEMPMDGKHGEGVCYQTWVEQGGFGQACRNAARWAPSIIFLGEVRDSEAAVEALRASINGRLVICTFHADSVIATFERFYSIATAGTASSNSSEDVASLMAHGMHTVLHQRLEHMEPGKKFLRTEALFVRDKGFEGCPSVIRSRRFEQLGSDITRQNNLMLMESRGRR